MCEESPDADIGELARKVADSEILNCFTKAGGLYFLLNPDFLFIWSHRPPSGPATAFWLIFTEVWREPAKTVTSSSPPSVSSPVSACSTSGLGGIRGKVSSQLSTSLRANRSEFTRMPGSLPTIWRQCPLMLSKTSFLKLPMQFFSINLFPSVITTGILIHFTSLLFSKRFLPRLSSPDPRWNVSTRVRSQPSRSEQILRSLLIISTPGSSNQLLFGF